MSLSSFSIPNLHAEYRCGGTQISHIHPHMSPTTEITTLPHLTHESHHGAQPANWLNWEAGMAWGIPDWNGWTGPYSAILPKRPWAWAGPRTRHSSMQVVSKHPTIIQASDSYTSIGLLYTHQTIIQTSDYYMSIRLLYRHENIIQPSDLYTILT